MRVITSLLFMSAISGFSQDYYDFDFEKIAKQAESSAAEDAKKVLETGRVMTLDSALILPGSCWDYANAVYDRAGYSWGGRENVYKTVKAGPYADVSKIKGGDWLYYVNHSYGDIEHSAIFIDWLDMDQKIGLMLSYGGESRHEPARYMPYDLSSVYGITRARAGSGESKNETKTVKINADQTKESVKTIVSETVSGVVSNGMKVEALKFGQNVQQMEIVGEASSFTGGRVYCWVRVSGGQGRFVKIKWYRDGTPVHESKLDIISNSMRTYSYKTVTGQTGKWTVEVVDPTGTVLHAASFTVN